MNVSSENKKLSGKRAVCFLAVANTGAGELSFCPRCGDRLLIPYKQDTAICYSCGWGATLPACLTHPDARRAGAGERDYISEERRAA